MLDKLILHTGTKNEKKYIYYNPENWKKLRDEYIN